MTGCFDGCGDEAVPSVPTFESGGVEMVRGPPGMSVGTLRGLGSHVWEATMELRGDRGGVWPSREITSKLVWSELDFWEFEEISGGTLRRERQVDRNLYRRHAADARWTQSAAPAGNALILQRTLQLWTQATAGFEPQLAWRELGEEVIEGRPVRVLRVDLAPPMAPDSPVPVDPTVAGNRMGLATTPLELTGTVYVDVETGSRLLAELDGRFVPFVTSSGHDLTEEVSILFRESRSITPLPPDIIEPAPERVVDRTRPGRPTYRLPPGAMPREGGR